MIVVTKDGRHRSRRTKREKWENIVKQMRALSPEEKILFSRVMEDFQDVTEAGESGFESRQEIEELTSFYFVLEGTVAITLEVPDRAVVQPLSNQITGHLYNTDITVSTVEKGNIFGWSALVPPNISTASAKAKTPCRVVEFNVQALRPYIEQDCCFGHLLTLKAAQVIRDRLRDRRIESLAEIVV